MSAFSKGQHVTGEYRGCGYTGVITVVTQGSGRTVVSVVLNSSILVDGENFRRTWFMTRINDAGDFTGEVEGFMALEVYPDTASEDFGVKLQSKPTDEPVTVDMGGDFEGFIETVNAQPTAQVWYTEPVTSADGEKIKARVTYGAGGGGNLIEVLANGVHVWGESETVYGKLPAQARAREMAMDYLRRYNYQRAIEMGDETETPASNYNNPWDYDEDEARVKKHDRMAEIRRKLERLDRERDSLLFELAQLTGE